MYEESAISILRKLPESKSQADNFVRLIRESIENGETDVLLAYKNISMLEHIFKKLKSDLIIKDVVLEEAERFNQKTFEYQNTKFTIKEVGSTYKYERCNDTVWNDLSEKIKELTDKRKEREAFLRTIKRGMEIYNEEGTLIEPPIKQSTTAVTVTLK
jgi:hypothetical protein